MSPSKGSSHILITVMWMRLHSLCCVSFIVLSFYSVFSSLFSFRFVSTHASLHIYKRHFPHFPIYSSAFIAFERKRKVFLFFREGVRRQWQQRRRSRTNDNNQRLFDSFFSDTGIGECNKTRQIGNRKKQRNSEKDEIIRRYWLLTLKGKYTEWQWITN